MTIQGIHIHIENIHKFYLYFILNPIILTLTVEISMSFFAFLLYTFIYFVGLGTLLSAVLGVSPFVCFSIKTNEVFLNPFSDWIFLIHEFQWGLWAVDSGINFVIFLCFILFFPLWILCWFWVRKLRFFRILKKPFYYFKRKKIEKRGTSPLPLQTSSALMNRPKAMPKSVSFGNSLPSQLQNAQKQQSETPPMPPEQLNTATQQQQKETFTQEQKNFIQQLGQSHELEMFERILLNDFIVPLVLASDTRAFLITALNQDTEWIADESITDGYDKPTWFSTQGLLTSPVFELTKAAETLHEKEPDSEIISVVILTQGSIINASLMQKNWAKEKAFVVRLNESIESPDCITLAELLDRDSFSFEELPETEPEEQEEQEESEEQKEPESSVEDKENSES